MSEKSNPSRESNPEPTAPIKFYCSLAPNCGGGVMHMKIGDQKVSVMEGSKERGHFVSCIGGSIEFEDNKRSPGKVWLLDAEALWGAFQAALDTMENADAVAT